ncbi:acyl-CoA dehydrogenase family protein [Jiangella endophytica]|uniref:acyl-CoA dehydrogenase family protein n=1 Tax=Jiangella endophytica TaxID=1623398 RepID=UPI000E340C6B|nr:acyl-CoA dehydrogenase family protein [Jiangella endophytica]
MTIDTVSTDRFTAGEDRYQRLAEQFRPVFARIGENVLDREEKRTLPVEQVRWLRDAGFGSVRVPEQYGGAGASAAELFRLLAELARIDSNVAHIWRGHFAFLEVRLTRPDEQTRRYWAERAVTGIVVGNAQSEVGNANWLDTKSELTDTPDGGLVLNGEKYYSTGTIFADLINATARYGEGHANFPVAVDDPGVTVLDDWDGFGQRLTGTGTTRFADVPVDRAHLSLHTRGEREPGYTPAFYQLFLLVVLAGIGRAAVDDATAYLAARTRVSADGTAAKDDPLVQSVLGEASGLAYAAEAAVLQAAAGIDLGYEAKLRGETGAACYQRIEADVYRAQIAVIPLVLQVTTRIFEVGGASTTARGRLLDRHWRNARTVATHNPLLQRQRGIGHFEVHGELPPPFPPKPEPVTTDDETGTADG